MGFPRWFSGKDSTSQCGTCRKRGLDPWVGKNPWRKEWLPTLVFFPGRFHGPRCLADYSLWGHKESDMIKQLSRQHRTGI